TFLDLVAPLADEHADYVEVAPETLWRVDEHGRFVENTFHREIAQLVRRRGLHVVAHGVGLSLGTADPADAPRFERHLERIARDHATFDFHWYTDHLGASTLDGRAVTLPIALPHTDAAAAVVRERLLALQRVVPDVGCENSVFYFRFDDWSDEPAFLARILSAPRTWLLLDLHNVYTTAINLGIEPHVWLDRLDTSKVIEIHVSGGSRSDPAWLEDG